MYRLLSASKDTYITDKFIAGTRSLDSNVGQAGTLDLFKLYNETFVTVSASLSGVYELSRLLIQFDYVPLQSLTSSILNTNDSSFKCYLWLRDVYGGQTTPSNFSIRLIPVSKSWDEGRGFDVVAFRDLDSANFLTASISGGSANLWVVSGAAASGTLGDNIDVITSGNIGSGLQDLTTTQTFNRGDEDLFMDVTTIVSASMAGNLTNNGWRLSFTDAQESDGTTRFVKRFGSRHTQKKELHPKLVVKFNDQIRDSSGDPDFNVTQDFFTYNRVNGAYQNFLSGSTFITGANSLILRLIASKSVTFPTTSFSISHSASISHITRSLAILSQSFSASQFILGGIAQTGIYTSSVNLNLVTNTTLTDFLSGSDAQKFRYEWVSADGMYPFAGGYTLFKKPVGSDSNAIERNWVLNITNLKQQYNKDETVRLRVFVQDYNTEAIASRLPTPTKSTILENMKWRLTKAFSREVVIPFDSSATLCSFDGAGMYFDFWVQDLDLGEVYEFEFMITEGGKDYYVNNAGFKFKVMP